MTKARDTADAERQARRRRLEALRDDCRRHDQCAVKIVLVEIGRGTMPETIPKAARLSAMPFHGRWGCRALQDGRMIEMALWGGEEKAEKNSVAYLARLGRELAELQVPSACDFPELADLAMFELAARARAVKSWVPPTMPMTLPPMPEAHCRDEGEMKRMIEEGWKKAGFLEKIEREVPDVRAAIAEVCDELLEDKPSAPKRKQINPGALWHDAVKTLQLMRQAGEDPSDAKIAKAIGVSAPTFCRHVGSKREWTEARAGRMAMMKPQASRDPDSWSDDGP